MAELLRRDDVRLVTLTGPGGVGKTRLAIAVAQALAPAYADGAWFVDLAPISDPRLAPHVIAQTLGLRDAGSVAPDGRVAAFCRDRSLILLLDNFEHVLDAATLLPGWLGASPRLKILTTSRTPLLLSDERVWPVATLGLATGGEHGAVAEIARADAVRLFIQRAQSHDPAFAPGDDDLRAIADICNRLDGLPLAIELAAARITLLPPGALLERLERRLPTLAEGYRDAPKRQRTMRSSIAWSYDLLDARRQRVFRRLAVFAGGFTLDAAETVAAGGPACSALDDVGNLLHQALVHRLPQGTGPSRYGMLDTVREFGLDQLEAAHEGDAARERHAAFYLALAESRNPAMPVPGDPGWIARVAVELANFRAALTWYADRGEADALLRLSAALYELWLVRGLYTEGRGWLRHALAAAPATPSPWRIRALAASGVLASWQGDYDEAAGWYRQEKALADRLGDPYLLAEAHIDLGHLAYRQCDYDAAENQTATAYELLRGPAAAAPAAAAMTALARANLGYIAAARGDVAKAAQCFEAALGELRETGYAWGVGEALVGLGEVSIRMGRTRPAAALFAESLDVATMLDDPLQIAASLRGLATVAAAHGEAEAGARLLGASDAIAEAIGAPGGPSSDPVRAACLTMLSATLGSGAIRNARGRIGTATTDAAVAEARTVLQRLGAKPGEPQRHPLTPRERDVLRLLVAGKSDRQIADALFVSYRTVTTHTTSIFAKLGVASRTEAAMLAVREELL